MRLAVATGNPDKLLEFHRILRPLGIETIPLASLGVALDVEENGATFAENALIKARAIYSLTGMPAVADDSGLCVDALGGRPGVYSARYYGADTPYPQKIAALLGKLKHTQQEQRKARFVCAISCVLTEDLILECSGICTGMIGSAPVGDGGFGYDPVFMLGSKSFAQLSPAEKDRVSHRGKALRQLSRDLEKYLAAQPKRI